MISTSTLAILGYGLCTTLHSCYADRYNTFRALTKPLLMPMLLVFYSLTGGDSPWLYGALLFAWLGDIALLKHSKAFFMLGLVSFLLGHLCMSSQLFSLLSTQLSATLVGTVIVIMLGLALGLFNILRPHLGELKLPVLVYCLVLAGKGSLALLLAWQMQTWPSIMVAAGALIFMASDLTLAINRFVTPINKVHFWVMSSYTLAQGMMVFGLSSLS